MSCWQVLSLTVDGIVTLYATPNPFLLNEVCLNQVLSFSQLQL